MSSADLDSTRPPIDGMAPKKLETAIFAVRDVRDMEARLGFTCGVWGTCVGYATTRRGYVEAVKIYYAPETINYAQLLELLFCWRKTTPFYSKSQESRDKSGIFFQTEQERRLACAAVDRNVLYTDNLPPIFVKPFKSFLRAENAAQKYYLHLTAWLYEELLSLYHTEDDLLSSTLAARLNGFLRCPSLSALYCMPESTELYGLSAEGLSALMALAN